ncbi:hypothetical protein OV079_26420 [Nannocystis pusilla]|uniref:Uncharacterized protein n=1 Tax=Nannocystis pusilla TaxID=889268 RepID=A0A9X3ESF5_9BACT|nr:hypothetical protein [Nannocystis pusilla]MCY1009031.1 hypothetical protein [Nannocystis pusilla]
MSKSSRCDPAAARQRVVHARRVRPATYSMAMKIRPAEALTSKIWTTLGCDSWASALASWRIRPCALLPRESVRTRLMATRRSSCSS